MNARAWTPPASSIPTMPIPRLEGIGRVHLVGIGGAGMRSLARLLVARGIAVQGSDLRDSRSLADLAALGVRTWVGHDAAHVNDPPRPDAIIVSSAIAESNPERRAARAAGIPLWFRQQAVAALGAGRRRVAVAGTHGKTTTTSMLAAVLDAAGLEPSYLIGGDLNETGGGARHGAGDLFVFEADESDGSFLLGDAWTGVITNIEVDHIDFYPGGLPDLETAFAAFAASSRHVVACIDDPAVRRTLDRVTDADVVTYGQGPDADLRLEVRHLGPDGARGVVAGDAGSAEITLAVDGAHNLANATAALAVALLAGCSLRRQLRH